jgi:maltooligosyltrehalose trehalohydrolase
LLHSKRIRHRAISQREDHQSTLRLERRYPVGAELVPGGVDFRVWAPAASHAQVHLENAPAGEPREIDMHAEEGGYFSVFVPALGAGARYRFRLNERREIFPDPASRFQPDGPHGASQVVDPAAFRWADQSWPGVRVHANVIYEMHVGTFTQEGTWRAAACRLPELAETGVTIIEMMPVADFPGRFGWGYDGVNLFAPTRLYGTPDDLRSFIDRAHALDLAVILDVVYNHFGPDGNYVAQFSPDYFSSKHGTDWGRSINFDGANCAAVREFYISNAAYWIDEFHFDGLRFDATQDIHDDSSPHILREIAAATRHVAGHRRIFLVAESDRQDAIKVTPPEQGGYGLDAVWNDDFHHAARVALLGRREAFYSEFKGAPQEFVSSAKYGYLFQGQWHSFSGSLRGTPSLDLAPSCFVNYLQNHDQISNSARGERPDRLGNPAQVRALTALLLLGPATPMLFQGQEFGASAPFFFFFDHNPELAAKIREGRAKFLAQFPSLASHQVQQALPDPANFDLCKLDFSEREANTAIYALHQDLIKLRRTDPVFAEPRRGSLDGAVLSENAFALRYFGGEKGDRLLLINLGGDLLLDPAPEPLLAPPAGSKWKMIWSSEDPRYGGSGIPGAYLPDTDHHPADTDHRPAIAAHSALLLESAAR